MGNLPPILLENLGVSFDLRRSKKRVRRSMVGKVQRQWKGPKLIVYKMRPKKHYRRFKIGRAHV